MKTKFFMGMIVLLSMSLMSSTCSNDDDSSFDDDGGSSIVQLEASITVGTWQVADFVEDGNDQTFHFSGYSFSFTTNGNVTATNGDTTMNGTWVTGTDDSTPKFILNFNVSDGPFEEISEDWRIENTSSTVIELRHVSGGDGSVDLLTFTRL